MSNSEPEHAEEFIPGFWVDDDGDLHIDIAELLKEFGWPDTQENRDKAAALVRDVVGDAWPDVPITEVK